MRDRDLCHLSLAEVAGLIRRKRASSVEVTQAVLDQIDEANPRLNAFITVLHDQAMTAAKEADRELARRGPVSPLHGVPVSLKDLYDTVGVRTTAASRVFADRVPKEDATVVKRLKQADAIIVGKANMTEFAYGGTHSESGEARNPWDLARTPGGSSSGSGMSVAAGMSYASMGSDTGGSIRIPAAFCAVVGLKPTFGRVSRRGVIPLSWTLDHAGPLARTVRDAAIVLRVVAGRDPYDLASSDAPVPDYTRGLANDLKGCTLGIPRGFYYEELDREVAATLGEAHRALRRLGARLREVEIPHAGASLAAMATIIQTEAATYHWPNLRTRPGDFSDAVRGRFVQGTMVPAVTYLKALRVRATLIQELHAALEEVDALVLPTVPIPPHKTGERPVTREGVSLVGRCTGSFNLAGLPALTVPCGFTKAGLPVGAQVVGRPFDEATLFKIGHAYEQATEWHMRRPPG